MRDNTACPIQAAPFAACVGERPTQCRCFLFLAEGAWAFNRLESKSGFSTGPNPPHPQLRPTRHKEPKARTQNCAQKLRGGQTEPGVEGLPETACPLDPGPGLGGMFSLGLFSAKASPILNYFPVS